MKLLRKLKNWIENPIISNLIFWSWNLLFIALFIVLEAQTGFISWIFKDGLQGDMPFNFVIFSSLLFLFPVFSVILAARKLVYNSKRLIKWFYCIEIPVMSFSLFRLAGVGELTGGVVQIITIVLLGIITYGAYLLFQEWFLKEKWIIPKLVGLSSIFLIVAWVSIILLVFMTPVSFIALKEFLSFDWLDIFDHGEFLLALLGLLFAAVTGTLLLLYPIYAFGFYLLTLVQSMNRFRRLQPNKTWVTVITTVLVSLVLFFYLNWNQPQQYVFDLYDRIEEAGLTDELKEEVWDNERKLKRGIMNAHLAKHRYVNDEDDDRGPTMELYKEAFGSEKLANSMSGFIRDMCLPFIYQGDMYDDKGKSRELYGMWFDESLHIAERERIAHATNSTWDRRRVESSMLDINEEKVLVEEQHVNVTEEGNFAKVELHEVYRNQTFDQKEIFYYFTLPEDAVISGLWLSDNDSIEKQYDFRVSPRGAAQKIYKREVQRRVDPSLLEKVGPRQYRLRAFPIAPKTKDYSRDGYRENYTVIEGQRFHLWMEYTVATFSESWPKPKVVEQRNVFTNKHTNYYFNSEKVRPSGSDWIPYSIERTSKDGASVFEYNKQEFTFKPQTNKKVEISSQSIDIQIDNSYSMFKNMPKIKKALAAIKDGTTGNIRIKVGEHIVNSSDEIKQVWFWGKEQAMPQITSYINSESESIQIFITDAGSYELTTDSLEPLKTKSQLYILHVDENWSKAYQDNLNETIKQNGGNSYGNVPALLNGISNRKSTANAISISNDIKIEMTAAETEEDGIHLADKIIASKLIQKQIPNLYGSDRLQLLDDVHQQAKTQKIVTDYSSMIVLVNQQQHKDLDEAEKDDDRFKRENEVGDEPSNLLGLSEVSGTPEPHEWLLLILSMIMLFVVYRKKQLAKA